MRFDAVDAEAAVNDAGEGSIYAKLIANPITLGESLQQVKILLPNHAHTQQPSPIPTFSAV